MTPSLQIGSGNWAVKSDSLLGYKTIDGKYYPREMTFTRATTGTRVNAAGLVEVVPYNLLSYSEDLTNGIWSNSNLTITANSIIAPNGTLTADKIENNATVGNHFVRQVSTVTSLQAYTLSVYLKEGTKNIITIADGLNTNELGTYNLITQTATNRSGTNASIISVGNGWYRCSLTYTPASTSLGFMLFSGSTYAGPDTSGNFYAWGAQLVEGTQPLTYLPTTDRLDIPRIDYSGGEAALLVEPQRTNLLTYSEQFDNNTAWARINSSITANSAISPSGIQNADKFVENNGTGAKWIYNTPIVISGSVYTYSVFAKKGERDFIYINAFSNGNFRAWFNLNTGTIGTTDIGASAKIENYGNGWYKCSVTFTAVSGTNFYLLGVSNANNVENYTGDGTSGIYIWGAQNELGSYPTSYIPTTSASVTRNADTCTKTGISSLIGQTEGTIFLDLDNIPYNSDWLTLNPISGSPYTNGIGIGYFSNSVRLQLYSPSGNVATTITAISGRNKIAIGYKSGDTVIYINGVNVFSSAGTFSFGVLLDGMTVGSSSWIVGSAATNKIYSHSLYNTRLTNSELIQLTTP